jgi:tRNA (cmo5U34)-methyltransferase
LKKNQGSGDNIVASIGNWSFSKKSVAKNFKSHANKSIPFYEEGHNIICKISDFFLKKNSICYELGCSRGDLLKKIMLYTKKNGINFYGIDLEQEMIVEAKKNLRGTNKKNRVTIRKGDIIKTRLKKNDLTICYYTIQFINPQYRQLVINKIYRSLNWGGALIMFEKVRAKDARFQDYMSIIYNNFKSDNGYSADEILNKTNSLKGIMEPFSENGNLDLIKRAGFKDFMTIFKWVSFQGFLAIK